MTRINGWLAPLTSNRGAERSMVHFYEEAA